MDHTLLESMSLLETLFDNEALCGYGATHDHPALVVEVAQNDLHATPDFSEGV
jgi:hypothetical protein